MREKGRDFAETIARLTELAQKFNAAAMAVSSSIPARTVSSGLRTGSVANQALINAARSIWMMALDLERGNRRRLIPIATNLCGKQLGRAFYNRRRRCRVGRETRGAQR